MKKHIKLFLYLTILTIGTAYTLHYLSINNFRAQAFIPLILFLLIPTILKKIFKINISNDLEITYLIFILLTHVGGSIINLYDVFDSYDIFLHTISGLITAFLALIILKYSKIDLNKNKKFTVIYLLAFKFLIAGIWEFYEYGYDLLAGGNMQNASETGILDTMSDNISAYIGGIIIIILFLIPKTNKIINNILNKKHITKR